MPRQEPIEYQRIAKATEYIQSSCKLHPNLDEVAEKLNLSPAHFQKLFTGWAGTSPGKFLELIRPEHAKRLLKEEKASLSDALLETGLSGTGRLHSLFVKMEAMLPAEYKNGGKNLNISYSCSDSPFGNLLAASTEKGICYMAFGEDKENALRDLQNKFPNAFFIEKEDELQKNARSVFNKDPSQPNLITLHLKGTDFQLKVWRSLLKIPFGKLSTYGNLADTVGSPKASRAVGTAIGSNPVAFIIPCHRVIQSSGKLGGYMWGTHRKQLMIGWESAKISPTE